VIGERVMVGWVACETEKERWWKRCLPLTILFSPSRFLMSREERVSELGFLDGLVKPSDSSRKPLFGFTPASR